MTLGVDIMSVIVYIVVVIRLPYKKYKQSHQDH
jgi:hypothetical protein